MKITEYPKTQKLTKDDVFLLDGEGGTRQIDAEDASLSLGEIVTDPVWVSHRNTYRGKNLGNKFTDEQKAHISDGSFKGLYVGDYWEVDNNNYRIADINYWLNTGDQTPKCSTNHLVIVPDKNMYSEQMNTEKTTANGYLGSKMYTSGLASALSTVKNIFGSNNILEHRQHFSNLVTDGIPITGAWVDNEICLMNENMIYGSTMTSSASNGSRTSMNGITIDKDQLVLFQYRKDLVLTTKLSGENESYWLRNVATALSFSGPSWYGTSSCFDANVVLGVRPVFGVTG